jgi:uncharacterized protein YabE (DUF348 family)
VSAFIKYKTTEEFVRTTLGRTDFKMPKQEQVDMARDDEAMEAYQTQLQRVETLQRMIQATVDLEHVLELPSGTLFGNFGST